MMGINGAGYCLLSTGLRNVFVVGITEQKTQLLHAWEPMMDDCSHSLPLLREEKWLCTKKF